MQVGFSKLGACEMRLSLTLDVAKTQVTIVAEPRCNHLRL